MIDSSEHGKNLVIEVMGVRDKKASRLYLSACFRNWMNKGCFSYGSGLAVVTRLKSGSARWEWFVLIPAHM